MSRVTAGNLRRSIMPILELNAADQLANDRREWAELLAVTPGATFFQSLEWLEVYWRHFGARQRLRVLLVFEGDRLTGIVPLVVRRFKTRFGTCRALTFPLDDWGSFYGPIGADPSVLLAAALEHVRRTRRDWDVIDLRWMPPELRPSLPEPSFVGCGRWEQAGWIELTGSWDDYLAARPSQLRRTIRRCERRVGSKESVVHVRYRPQGEPHGDSDPRWDLYDACEDIARRSWQGSSADGTTLSHESVRQYLRETHAAAARVGGVDLNLLLLDGEPAAFSYNYHCRGRLYVLRLGYDPRFSDLGVGTVLTSRLLRDSFERGDTLIDYGPGSLDYKQSWLTSLEPMHRCLHYAADSPQAQLLKLGRSVYRWYRERFGQSSGVQGPGSVVECDDHRRACTTDN